MAMKHFKMTKLHLVKKDKNARLFNTKEPCKIILMFIESFGNILRYFRPEYAY